MSPVISQLNVFNFSQLVTKILSMELYNEKNREPLRGIYIYEPPSLSPHFSSGIEAVSECVMLTTLKEMYIFLINEHKYFVERFYLSYILSMHCNKVVFDLVQCQNTCHFSPNEVFVLKACPPSSEGMV